MKFYRLHRTVDAGISIGYLYLIRKADAEREARNHLRDNPGGDASFTLVEVEPTKTGILRALNTEACHPDNG